MKTVRKAKTVAEGKHSDRTKVTNIDPAFLALTELSILKNNLEGRSNGPIGNDCFTFENFIVRSKLDIPGSDFQD